MICSDVIIVGGGPAGSTCAWKLKQAGIECIILDKETFPRLKICAGWITPKVVKQLKLNLSSYPHSLMTFRTLHFYLYGKKISVPTKQYAIRRIEFDNWLLKRANVPVYTHPVVNIEKGNGDFIIDRKFRSQYLVGAGGTYCPVYKFFFKRVYPRVKRSLIIGLEEEFPYDYQNDHCHLWFFDNHLPGYSWYVPKGNGYLNIGIGGSLERLRERGDSIKKQWDYFTHKLEKLRLVNSRQFNPKGYNYYLSQRSPVGRIDNAFIIGDATRDMGEGIGPAVESGIKAAGSIITGTGYSLTSVTKYSFPGILLGKLYSKCNKTQQ